MVKPLRYMDFRTFLSKNLDFRLSFPCDVTTFEALKLLLGKDFKLIDKKWGRL